MMPNADAAHIILNLLREMGNGVSSGPTLIGAAAPIRIASRSVGVRGLLNLTALAAVDAAASKT
ncbi:phosphate acyltransferase [Cognatishimia sp. F0-27]|uniref:phosphate acyltransferase n=1 Tax=Cognatishimia sp. F0-27 TaxID=2816855 RepID=UPI00351D972A